MQNDECMKKYDVFISSKSEDYPLAEEVYRFLIQNGYSVFLASKELEKIGDSEYSKAIDNALDECTHLIVVSSKLRYIETKWVRYEWGTFCDDKKSGFRDGNLLTILDKTIEISELPPSLRHQQSFTFDNFRHEIIGYLKKEQESVLEDNEKETKSGDIKTIADSTSHTNTVLFIEKNQASLRSKETIVLEYEHVASDYQKITDDQLPYNYQPSFPSVFSRFLLFDMAFTNLAKQPNKGSNQGFMSLLASECLDLLEFLFLYAEHPDLEIRRVSLKDVYSCIKKDNTPAYQNLATVLKKDINQLPSFYLNTDVFLFLFRNQVIGGTSPLTLVFSSPQCKTIFQSFPDEFWGIKGQKLFKESVSFGERGEQFQEYMIRLLGAYRRNNSLYEYVRSQFDELPTRIFDCISIEDPQSLISQIRLLYPSICDEQGHEVLVVIENNYAIPLGHIQAEQMISTEYRICPTLPESPYHSKSGELIDLPIPLVLSETGMIGVHFFKNSLWNNTTVQIDIGLSDIPLNERKLPGTFLKYPYLVARDFFEDQIIELDFKANREHFFLIGDDGNTFLPPIKAFYFRYFTFKDLHQQLRCQIDENNNVEVSLDIPVIGNDSMKFISLHRTYNYHNDEIVSIKDSDFRLSVWPAYRLPKDELNNYSVSVGCYRYNNVRTRFVNLDSLYEDFNVKWHQIDNIRFCEIGYFDAIQIAVNDTQALLFPQFKEIKNIYPPLRVGIDIGSSSTRISYCDHGDLPRRLDIHPGQVMNLNIAHNDSPYWKSELTEIRMVQEEGEEVALPPYLPPYEHSRLYIGFMHTCDFKRAVATKSFCDQLVWILKNKIVETFGKYEISTINICLPFCISVVITEKIQKYLNEAFQHHYRNEISTEIVNANLSLLRFIWAHGHILSRPSLILDIGKQYTNVAFFEAEQNSMLNNSYPIGIGNLWESELLDYQSNCKLFHLWMDELIYGSNNEQRFLYEMEERMHQHADWTDFLFSNKPEYSWSTQRKLFDSFPDLRGICILFLAGIIWKVVRELEFKTVKKPDNIIISGRGFMPFLCFMGEHDLKSLVMALFSYFSQEHQHEFKVTYVNDAYAKADGAVQIGKFEPCPKVLPLCDIQDVVTYEKIDINTITNEFITFIQALRQFDITGLPLQLSRICDLFEQNALYGARSLQIQYKNDYYVSSNDAFFWPLKGAIPNVIREIL